MNVAIAIHSPPPPPPPPLSPSSRLSLFLPLQCASQAIYKHPLSVITRSHSSPTINEALAETTVPCDTEREPLSSDETKCPVSAYNEWDPLEVSLTKMKLYYICELKWILCHLAWVDQKRHHALYTGASRTVYTDRKLLPKKSIFSLHVATSEKPQMTFRGDTNYINHA